MDDYLHEWEEFLSGFSYKPGYVFRVEPFIHGVTLIVEGSVPDSNNPTKIVRVQGGRSISLNDSIPWMDEEEKQKSRIDHIVQLVTTFEKHEIDEWLKLNGSRLTNPH